MVQSEYNCSQQELYTVARLGWNSCSQHIVKFGNFKAKYIPAYITTHLNEITAASIIHDAQARGAKSEKLRVQLTEKNKEALDIWQGLKRYIADAFPENLQKATLEEAGQKHYEKASNYDWDATEGLLTSGSVFISDYQTELEADDNMPITFPAEFNTFKTEFTTLHQNFLNSREDSAVGTQDKVVANNVVYNKLVSMLLDGQYIFRKDEATKKQFLFSELLYKASGTGTAGIKGTVTDAITHLPLKNVEIKFLLTIKTGKTDDEGKYEIKQVAHGKFDIEASLEGYQTRTISEFEILIGNISTLNIELTPIVPEP